MNLLICNLLAFLLLAACGAGPAGSAGIDPRNFARRSDTCDNPDASVNCCFLAMPPTLDKVMRIAGKDEAGERMVIKGKVYKEDSKTPYPNVTLYAYHTNSKGYYAKAGKETGVQRWHGKLHGWCRTDRDGSYEIQSIRPAPYPSNTMPAHIHMAVKEPLGRKPFYLTDFVFADDGLVNEQYLKALPPIPGGSGVVTLVQSEGGVWHGQRDIMLPRMD